MKFSQFAGTSLVPLLGRIVLALAFVTTGYNKLMRDKVFSAQQAETLRTLGVSVAEMNPAPAAGATAAIGSPTIVLASFQDTPEEGATQTGEETGEQTGEETGEQTGEETGEETGGDETADESGAAGVEPAANEDEDAVTETGADTPLAPDEGQPVVPPLADGQYMAKGVHSVTLLCHMNNWPMPTLMAYVAGITELLGGALVLVGFLTRIWALGLAFAMGVAFYFVSMGFNNVTGVNPFDFAMEIPKFNTAMSQLGLFVLSFGLLMTGAGPVSIDRLLFGGGRRNTKRGPEIEYEDVDSSHSRAL